MVSSPTARDRALLELKMTRGRHLRLTKSITFGVNRWLELFLEMFNVPNVVDLTGGNNNMNVTAFLIRTGARDPRQIQWGARYTF